MNHFSIDFPLQKINREMRIVTGIATANNIDLENDLISAEASREAFSNWVGNIREMHDPKSSVGKLLDWRPTQIMHKGKMYDAIEVDIYISKGAENTWQKILDGTLRGFSICGAAKAKERVWNEDAGRMVNLITKYELGELSVVDNPCNPAGLFMLIKKAADGTLVMAVGESDEEKDVYYCSEHQYATINTSICPSCIKDMNKIGIVKEFDAEVINKMIEGYDLEMKGGSSNTMDLQEKNKDDIVSTMDIELTDEQKQGVLIKLGNAIFSKSEDTSASNVVIPNITINIEKGITTEEEVSEVDSKNEDVVEKSIDTNDIKIEEEEDSHKEEEMDIEALGALLDEKLTKFKEEISADVDEKIDTISKSVEEVKEQAETAISEAKDEIEKVANTGAEKKSVDVLEENDEDVIEKNVKAESFWGGIFVPQGLAEALGYES